MGYFRDNGHDISEDEFCDAYNQTGTFSEKNVHFGAIEYYYSNLVQMKNGY